MISINIKTIPHNQHRYETVGDWWWDGETLEIRVSDMGNWKYEFLVAFHELAEVMICKFNGIKQEDVDAFDKNFEEERERGLHSPDEEPGDDPKAPYRMAHFWATNVERALSALLGVDWKVYDATVMGLGYEEVAK